MTAKLPPEVEAAIDEAERSVYRYRAIITRSPYEGQFKQALDSREEWKAAITAACEKAYAAGQVAELENAQSLPCPQCNCGTTERRLAKARAALKGEAQQ